MPVSVEAVQLGYVAYYGRPADVAGLAYWLTAGEAAVDQRSFAANLSQTRIWRDLSRGPGGEPKPLAVLDLIYRNLFGRDADEAGRAYWIGELSRGRTDLDRIGADIAWAAFNLDASKPDRRTMLARLEAAIAFTNILDTPAERTNYEVIVASYDPTTKSFLDARHPKLLEFLRSITDTPPSVTSIATSAAVILGGGGGGGGFVLTVSSPSQTEGNSGVAFLSFVLALDKAPTVPVSVNYETLTSGTATPGVDFVPQSGTVVFAVGQTTHTVSIPVIGDVIQEPDETVVLRFFGGVLDGEKISVGTILNDDNPPPPPPPPPPSLVLTSGMDTLVGTGGADIFQATHLTLTAGDSLNGAGGVDKLVIADSGSSSGASFSSVLLTSIEEIEYLASNNANNVLSLSAPNLIERFVYKDQNTTPKALSLTTNANVSKIEVVGASSATIIDSAGVGALIEVDLSKVGSAIVTSSALSSLAVREASAASVWVSGPVGSRNVTLQNASVTSWIDTTATAVSLSVTGAATTIGTLSLNSGLGAFSIGGDKAVTITNLLGPTSAAIVSSNTAGVTIGNTLPNGVAFQGGSGNDTVTLAATTKAISLGAGDDTAILTTNLGSGGSLNGGPGSDTLRTTANIAALVTAPGFERLEITGGGGAVLATNFVNLSEVAILGALTAATAFSNLPADAKLVLQANPTLPITWSLLGAGTNLSDVGRISFLSGTGLSATIAVPATETILVDTGTAGPAHSLILNNLQNNASVAVTGQAGITLTVNFVSGSNSITVSTAGVSTGVVTVNAGTNVSQLVFVGGPTSSTVTGSNGADILTGGSGNDILTGGAGGDVLTGGAGSDIFVYTTLAHSKVTGTSSSKAGMDRILDFSPSDDKINVSTTPATVYATTVSWNGNWDTTIGNAISNIGGSFSANAVIVMTITGTNAGTYLVINDGTAGWSSTDDAIVEITGVSGIITTSNFI